MPTNQSSNSAPSPRIIAFTKDWDDVPTCTTHILREMGRTMPVLWISSIGVRRPSLRSGGDIRRILARLRRAGARARGVERNIRVLSPLLIPSARGRISQALNLMLLDRQISRELADMGDGRIEYWCFVPNAVDFVPKRREIEHMNAGLSKEWGAERNRIRGVKPQSPPDSTTDNGQRTTDPLVVYYCTDDWSKFENHDSAWISGKEEQLLARADVVFVSSRFLEQKFCGVSPSSSPAAHNSHPSIHYMPHGVEYEKFAVALDGSGRVPADIAAMPKPVIGFYGNIYPWVDFELVEKLARARPAWTFVMIGQVHCDVSRFAALPNVRFFGRREHDALPDCCRGFDAAMIPYDMAHARMISVNPVKTKELLAAGVPVVASKVPELEGYGEDVITCVCADEWLRALEKQIGRTDRAAISGRMKKEDWGIKVREIREAVSG